jgi:hypothetical protein
LRAPLVVGAGLQRDVVPARGEGRHPDDGRGRGDARLVGRSVVRAERAHGDAGHAAARHIGPPVGREAIHQHRQVEQVFLAAAEAVQQEDDRAAVRAVGTRRQPRDMVDGEGFENDLHVG